MPPFELKFSEVNFDTTIEQLQKPKLYTAFKHKYSNVLCIWLTTKYENSLWLFCQHYPFYTISSIFKQQNWNHPIFLHEGTSLFICFKHYNFPLRLQSVTQCIAYASARLLHTTTEFFSNESPMSVLYPQFKNSDAWLEVVQGLSWQAKYKNVM